MEAYVADIGHGLRLIFDKLNIKPRSITMLQVEALQDIILDFFDDDGSAVLTFSKDMWYRAEISQIVKVNKNGNATHKVIIAGEGDSYTFALLALIISGIHRSIFDDVTINEIKRVLQGKLTNYEHHKQYEVSLWKNFLSIFKFRK